MRNLIAASAIAMFSVASIAVPTQAANMYPDEHYHHSMHGAQYYHHHHPDNCYMKTIEHHHQNGHVVVEKVHVCH
ncbi:hypothetical protein [Rhizobium sp. RAF56]|uniref:hypothetical protein n=1 Tax=Rhizobium sp. RAF56 TaxID=3233062 RepID=UPI003F9B3282